MWLKTLKDGLAYASVAILAAVSDWAVFAVISHVFPQHDIVWAQIPARLTGGLVAFLMHRAWSFRDQHGHGIGTEARRFLALYIFSFCLSVATVYLLVDVAGFGRYWSKAFADTLCFGVNFVAMKYYVFSAVQAPRRPRSASKATPRPG